MASLGAPGSPWGDQYHSVRSTVSTLAEKTSYRRLRARPTRALFLTVGFFIFVLTLLWRTPTKKEDTENYYLKFPSHKPSNARPEDLQIVPSAGQIPNTTDTLPNNLQKANPSFHLVIPARRKSSMLCRTLVSAMIMNYPPPTLVGYGKNPPEAATEWSLMVERIQDMNNFLQHAPHVKDDDFVLIADGDDVYFQLPPEIMIRRFQDLLKENNAKLRRKYGFVAVEDPANGGAEIIEQKYSQRVLFGASKDCFPNMTLDAGCASVPDSTLPPDAYGWDTDTDRNLIRPRFIKPGAAIGMVADLKLIYAEILRFVDRQRWSRGDYLALTQMFGRQEYVRELERRRTSSPFTEWMYDMIGISDATNMTKVHHPFLEPGQRYEFGIGIDYESRIFFNELMSKGDVEWLKYNDVERTSAVQMEHGVPREHRLLLPYDLSPENLGNPFIHPKYGRNEILNPPLSFNLDALPNPNNRSWSNLPLMTNIHSTSVPAMIHLDGDHSIRDHWWQKMWYHPWARALLRKYVRSPIGFDAAQSALLGGQEWWDLRGGKGGIWTDKGEWIDFGEVCTGFERDIFNDELGQWRQEGGEGHAEPVYNQFGNLVKGKEG
ncbi:glycosyltransferase domain-containing protein [Aspergillus candidus]|uniref:Uncharacterized protein n=1 Tax=Aspergillus candidus TaxID=41067 RepID=A0A2I2FCS7_ASPCN|nr:hypothetical protein BDW47DRAFT_104850 [Aspergillus candidus]PLB38440.1 hypothetical protein BDW47DRAFT_104850 [Aspergillus candidus]